MPIGAEAGTGYYIVEGYHLPPVMFSKEEAAALLTGEKLMEQFSDHSNRKQFSLAMGKDPFRTSWNGEGLSRITG